ncbi:hypothetical protein F8M41_020315 [Gigaspora margarita]|uniref:Phosphatidylglycerol/phosphatidylinositol transfer protein n=1 Tax=Gigaspora margarita TaxID=4874 RepID=A0A8H4EJR2_GIGMA|nr:hypothetical protein F8M41_020315 [Gigaspora margarita]
MKELNFGFFALTLLVTLFVMVNTYPSPPGLNKFTLCPKDVYGPVNPIEFTMNPTPPVLGHNLFTISQNFTHEDVWYDIYLYNARYELNVQGYCIKKKDCDVQSIPVEFNSENSTNILTGPYIISVLVKANSNDDLAGCAIAVMDTHPILLKEERNVNH